MVPPWVLQPPILARLCPAQLLQPLSALELSSLQVHGAYTRRKVITNATGIPPQWWLAQYCGGGHLTPLQAGVRVWYKGAMYKVDDDAIHTSSRVRIIKEHAKGVKQHSQRYVSKSALLPHMHREKPYPVFSTYE